MSINFAQVKSLVIPEGVVSKITINNVDVWTGSKLEASIPQADWYTRSSNYFATQNRAFTNLIEANANGSTSVNTKITFTVYNPTEDASYNTSVNVTLALVSDGWYKAQSFGVRYDANNSKYNFGTTRIYRTGGNMGSKQTEFYRYTNWNSTTNNCVITNVTLEVLSYN